MMKISQSATPVGLAHPGISPKISGLAVSSHSAYVKFLGSTPEMLLTASIFSKLGCIFVPVKDCLFLSVSTVVEPCHVTDIDQVHD